MIVDNATVTWLALYRSAPESFLSMFLATVGGTAGVAWLVIDKIYSGRVEALKERIQFLDARLAIQPDSALPKSGAVVPVQELTNSSLRKQAIDIASALRKIEVKRREVTRHSFFTRHQTDADRQAAAEREEEERHRNDTDVRADYGVIRGTAIVLRDEMKKRVPPSVLIARDRMADHNYEFQAGPSPYHEIADDLERLAHALPA